MRARWPPQAGHDDRVRFVEYAKGHGTGNDFVILPDPAGRLNLTPELVAALCDRRFGLGGDGVLRVVRTAAVAAATGDGALTGSVAAAVADTEWFMDYRNADGSLAETCGNGIRVFARFLVTRGWAPAETVVGTRAGPVATLVGDDVVTATMGRVQVLGPQRARVAGRELEGLAVDCGNPHLVCPVPEDTALAALDLTRPPVTDPAAFPHGVNVELVDPQPAVDADAYLRMRVYERGVGETLSCGSGAVAAAAAHLHRLERPAGVVAVEVPGGRLTVSLTAGEAALSGPAVLVAHGTVDLAALRPGDVAARHRPGTPAE